MEDNAKRIAIIAFNYAESTICLAKYLARLGYEVDYYLIATLIHDKGVTLGVEYKGAPRRLGLIRLTEQMAPELLHYGEGLPVRWHLLRILWLSPKARLLNAPIWHRALRTIRREHYDAIEIVGHHPWVSIIHNALKHENICHTFHEVGSHQDGIASTPLMDLVIRDRSRVILHSRATYERFAAISGAYRSLCSVIPFGKFETNLLYGRDVQMDIPLDLSRTTFLFYGFLKPYKGLDILAEAVKQLNAVRERFNLIIAGGGSDATLDFFRNLDNCYVLNRFLSTDEMMKLNKLASVIVLPYHTASQTGIIPTSFLYGKPVIATRVGAFAETVRDGVNGLLVVPEDTAVFAAAMQRCIDDPDLVKSLSLGTRAYGQGDEYDWNNIAKQHLKVYGI